MEIKEGTVIKINEKIIYEKTFKKFVGLYTNVQGNVPYRGPKGKNYAKSRGNRPVMFLKTTNDSYYFCRFQGVNSKDLYNENKKCKNPNYLRNGGFGVFEEKSLNDFFIKDSMLCLDSVFKINKKDFDLFCENYEYAITTSKINNKCLELIKNDINFSLGHNLPNIPIVEINTNKLFQKPTIINGFYYNQIGVVVNCNPLLIENENYNLLKPNFTDNFESKTNNLIQSALVDKFKKWEVTPELQKVLDDFRIQPTEKVLEFSKNSKDFDEFMNDENPNKLTEWFPKEELITENSELLGESENNKNFENSINNEKDRKLNNEYKDKSAIGFDNANQQKAILDKKNEQVKNDEQKKVIEKENNKYRDALDKIDNKIDELQKSFENEINKLNQQKEKLMEENKKLVDSVKNKDVKDKKLKETVKENVNKLKNKDLTKNELKKEINKLKTKKEENTKKVTKPKELQSKTSKNLKKEGIVRKESKPLKSNKPKMDFVKFGNMRNNRMNQNPMMDNKPKEKSRGGREFERTLFKK